MKKIVIFCCFFILNACCVNSPKTELYMLNSEVAESVSKRSVNVAVLPVEVSDLLNRQQIVLYEKDSPKVKILEFNRWGEALPYVLQETVTNDLISYLPNSFVKSINNYNDILQYNVKVKVNKIEAYRGDKVRLSVWWKINNKDRIELSRKQAVYEVKAEGNEITDVVNAYSKVVNMMSRDIAIKLAKL